MKINRIRVGVVWILFLMISIGLQADETFKKIRITDFEGSCIIRQNSSFEKSSIRRKQAAEDAVLLSRHLSVPLINAAPFMSLAVVWEGVNWQADKDRLFVRLQGPDEQDKIIKIEKDSHSPQSEKKHISQLYFIDPGYHSFQFRVELSKYSEAQLEALEFHFYNPGATDPLSAAAVHAQPPAPPRAACPCPLPALQSRAQWCPTNNCPPNPEPANTNVTHLIVHHSAGTNTSSDWSAIVRSIWNFHVNTNGWSDIGYNYLVDPNGVLYEGRGNNILGAHFCGQNLNTMGVCVLGNFTSSTPTDQAIGGLVNLLAWKACDVDADPLAQSYHAGSGMTLHHVSGHRDGCATACPGDAFYPTLPAVRQQIVDEIEACKYLAAPSALTGMPTPAAVIELNWQDNSSIETSFIIERSPSNNNNYQQIGTTNADVTTFDDPNVVGLGRYFYRVKAANDQDTSEYSNEAEVVAVLSSTQSPKNDWIRVHPNPVQNILMIDFSQKLSKDVEFEVIALANGRIMYSSQTSMSNSQYQLIIDYLPKGVYLLQVKSGTRKAYQKIVKM